MKSGASGRCVAIVVTLLAMSALSACETQRQIISLHEDRLSAAGFIIKPANTPERQAMLTRLPANKFVMRQNGDSIHYVYADPLVCGCLYVGTQLAYNQYKANELAQHLADEQQLTAQTYSDAAWSWSAWGPWGPSPGFGFAYGAWGW
jgi:mannitol/fructose-specific phosphotransferase system IIA component (Ntr-type)